MKKKSAGIAALLSFLVPGAGQIYCEFIVRGIVFFVVYGILIWNSFANTGSGAIWYRVAAFALWVWNIFDSKRKADWWNQPTK